MLMAWFLDIFLLRRSFLSFHAVMAVCQFGEPVIIASGCCIIVLYAVLLCSTQLSIRLNTAPILYPHPSLLPPPPITPYRSSCTDRKSVWLYSKHLTLFSSVKKYSEICIFIYFCHTISMINYEGFSQCAGLDGTHLLPVLLGGIKYLYRIKGIMGGMTGI